LRLVWHHGNCRLTVHFYQRNHLLFPAHAAAVQSRRTTLNNRIGIPNCIIIVPREFFGNSFSKMRDCSRVPLSFMRCGIADLTLSRRHFLSLGAALSRHSRLR
jgi:hypothetical protein